MNRGSYVTCPKLFSQFEAESEFKLSSSASGVPNFMQYTTFLFSQDKEIQMYIKN